MRYGIAIGSALLLALVPVSSAGDTGSASRPVPVQPIPVQPGPADAQETYEAELALAVKALVTGLEEYAEWTGGKKLFADRDRAYELLLELDPEHTGAHKGLKHKRNRDGTWEVPEGQRESRNYSKEHLEESAERWGAVATAFSDRVLGILEFYEADVTDEQRREAYRRLLSLDPDDAAVHALLGEHRMEDRWVLEDTLTAKERRGALKQLVRDVVGRVPRTAAATVSPEEQALGIDWKVKIQTPKVRLLGTCDAKEAELMARLCHAGADVVRQLFKGEVDLLEGYTIYVLPDMPSRDLFLEKWPRWTDEERKNLPHLAGTGVPYDIHLVRWDEDEPRRLDGAMRHTIGLILKLNYDIDVRVAWAWEGFGMYLTREMVGTRLTFYCRADDSLDKAIDDLRGRLLMSDVNWMNEAYQLMKSGRAPPLEAILARDINAMRIPDVLISYAFAAFLVEGRPEQTPALLARIGKGESSVEAVPAVLGMDLPTLELHFLRWLSERR